MSSLSADRILDPETREELGEPVEEKPSKSFPPPYHNEIRWYPDDILTIAGPALNFATSLSPRENIGIDWEESDIGRRKILDWLSEEFSEPGNNPVYVNKKILDIVPGEEPSTAYIRYRGDKEPHPIRLRSKDTFDEHVEDHDLIELGIEDRKRVRSWIEENNFLVPSIPHPGERETVSSLPAVIGYQEGNDLIASENDSSIGRYGGEEIGHSGIHTDVYRNSEGNTIRIVMDLSSLDYEEIELEAVESGIGVFVDSELVYTHSWPKSRVTGRELPNGLYEIYPD